MATAHPLVPVVELLLERNRSQPPPIRGRVRLQIDEEGWEFHLGEVEGDEPGSQATLGLTAVDADGLLAGRTPEQPVFAGDLELLDAFMARCVQPLPWFAAELRSRR